MQASWIRLDGFIPANRFVLRLERGGSNLLIGSAIPQASKQACNEACTEDGQQANPTNTGLFRLLFFGLVLCVPSVCGTREPF